MNDVYSYLYYMLCIAKEEWSSNHHLSSYTVSSYQRCRHGNMSRMWQGRNIRPPLPMSRGASICSFWGPFLLQHPLLEMQFNALHKHDKWIHTNQPSKTPIIPVKSSICCCYRIEMQLQQPIHQHFQVHHLRSGMILHPNKTNSWWHLEKFCGCIHDECQKKQATSRYDPPAKILKPTATLTFPLK